jgi:hypothetical protein
MDNPGRSAEMSLAINDLILGINCDINTVLIDVNIT